MSTSDSSRGVAPKSNPLRGEATEMGSLSEPTTHLSPGYSLLGPPDSFWPTLLRAGAASRTPRRFPSSWPEAQATPRVSVRLDALAGRFVGRAKGAAGGDHPRWNSARVYSIGTLDSWRTRQITSSSRPIASPSPARIGRKPKKITPRMNAAA